MSLIPNLTQGQINSFHGIASCCFASQYARSLDLQTIGDKGAWPLKFKMSIVGAMLILIDEYDPSKTTNCISYDDVLHLINFINKSMGVCMDLHDLPNIAPGDIIQN